MAQDILTQYLAKGTQVETFRVGLWNHVKSWSVAGNKPPTVTVIVEAAVTHYANTENGHQRGEAFRAMVMKVTPEQVEPTFLFHREKKAYRESLIEGIARMLKIQAKRVTLPWEVTAGDDTEPTRFHRSVPRNGFRSVPCLREHCSGLLMPNDDGDMRCLLCGREGGMK